MRRIRRRPEERAVRRGDEQSLYYILERDLDRDALFPHHDGWVPQVQTSRESRHKIDYVVEYDGKLVGIEIKCNYPKRDDFEHVEDYYAGSLNAVFLAYPSDRVGEAVLLAEENRGWRRYGLLSIALFRSHCIKRAKLRDTRYDNCVWTNYFNKASFLDDLARNPGSYMDKIERQQAIIEISKGPKKTLLRADEWKLMALILLFSNTYGYAKWFNWDLPNGLERAYTTVFSSHPCMPYRLERTGFVESYSYGSLLNMYTPSSEMLSLRPRIEEVLHKKYPKSMNQLEKRKDKILKKRKAAQKLGRKVFFDRR